MRKATHKEQHEEVYTLVGKENKRMYEEQNKFDGVVNIFQLSNDSVMQHYNMLNDDQGELHFKTNTFGGISKEKARQRFNLQQFNDKTDNKLFKWIIFILWEPTNILNTYPNIRDVLDKLFVRIEPKQAPI
ncbi:hypothetical protein [Staphylococcus phage vB_SauH_DELF3]|nr:hypothetical protein [Staphylococcus phage vB_SauH_DELF3]